MQGFHLNEIGPEKPAVVIKKREEVIGKPVNGQAGKSDSDGRSQRKIGLKRKTEDGKADAQEKGGNGPPRFHMLLLFLPYSQIHIVTYALVAPGLGLIIVHTRSSILLSTS